MRRSKVGNHFRCEIKASAIHKPATGLICNRQRLHSDARFLAGAGPCIVRPECGVCHQRERVAAPRWIQQGLVRWRRVLLHCVPCGTPPVVRIVHIAVRALSVLTAWILERGQCKPEATWRKSL